MSKTIMRDCFYRYGGLLGVLFAMIAVFSFQSQNFFQQSTLTTIANQIPDLTLIAVGMTLVLVIRGIDLSVGSILALSSAVLGSLMIDHSWSLWPAILAGVLAGAVCGFINGFISIGFKLPSFIVTLGMLEIARGATKLVTDSQTKYIGSKIEVLSEPTSLLNLSPAILFALGTVVMVHIVLTKTVFGRYCIAIGTNEEAVRMSGIWPAPYSIAVFTVSGLLCGIAGATHASRLASADPNAGIGLELSAIAACVIGGTSLMGGRGNILCSFIGVLIIAVLQTGLAQIGVSDAMKQIITGGVIVIAVLLDAMRSRWSGN